MEDKFAVVCVNTQTINCELGYFFLEDDNGNTEVFDSEQDAKEAIKKCWQDGPLMYAVLSLGELDFN